jgi:hypothetical protein
MDGLRVAAQNVVSSSQRVATLSKLIWASESRPVAAATRRTDSTAGFGCNISSLSRFVTASAHEGVHR